MPTAFDSSYNFKRRSFKLSCECSWYFHWYLRVLFIVRGIVLKRRSKPLSCRDEFLLVIHFSKQIIFWWYYIIIYLFFNDFNSFTYLYYFMFVSTYILGLWTDLEIIFAILISFISEFGFNKYSPKANRRC